MISEPALGRELEAVPRVHEKRGCTENNCLCPSGPEPDYAAMAHLVVERYGPVVEALEELIKAVDLGAEEGTEVELVYAKKALAAAEGERGPARR